MTCCATTVISSAVTYYILRYLAEQGPTPYGRLHTEFDPYNSGSVGLVLYGMIESDLVKRLGRDRVKISDLGRRTLQEARPNDEAPTVNHE
jgi:DNA-binding PadR family transcriptional regulator